MPVMPRPNKAKKIADKVMKKNEAEKAFKKDSRRDHGENKFESQIRTMIQR
jgi:hypothetical protein